MCVIRITQCNAARELKERRCTSKFIWQSMRGGGICEIRNSQTIILQLFECEMVVAAHVKEKYSFLV
jgi:hypothetical protein